MKDKSEFSSGVLTSKWSLQDSNTSIIDMFYMDKIVFDKICTTIYTNR